MGWIHGIGLQAKALRPRWYRYTVSQTVRQTGGKRHEVNSLTVRHTLFIRRRCARARCSRLPLASSTKYVGPSTDETTIPTEEKQVNEYIAKIDKLVDDLKMAGALLTSERELCLYVDQLPKELVPYRANIYQQLGTTNKEKMKVGLIRYCGMIRDGEDKDGKESGLATIDKQSPLADERKC